MVPNKCKHHAFHAWTGKRKAREWQVGKPDGLDGAAHLDRMSWKWACGSLTQLVFRNTAVCCHWICPTPMNSRYDIGHRGIQPLPSPPAASLPKRSHWQSDRTCPTHPNWIKVIKVQSWKCSKCNRYAKSWFLLAKCGTGHRKLNIAKLINVQSHRLHRGWLYTLRRTSLRDSSDKVSS